jgi:hypothetical protein
MLKRLVLLGAAIASPAVAQDAEFTRFAERVTAETPPPSGADLTAGALRALKGKAVEAKTCVPSAVVMEASRSATADRGVADLIRAGQIRNGWTANGRPQGCKWAPLTRFLALRTPDGKLVVHVLNFGETFASPSLMKDALNSAATAMAVVFADCKEPGVTFDGTRVDARSPDLSPDWHGVRYAGTWTEAWTFSACGRSAEVPVTFTADGQSGAYFSIAASGAKRLDPVKGR